MATITAARAALAATLGAPDHVPDVIDPPCVLIEPGDPYLEYPEIDPWGTFVARLDVYVLVPSDDNEAYPAALDTQLVTAIAAIEDTNDWSVQRVNKPGVFFTADWTAYGVLVNVAARVTR